MNRIISVILLIGLLCTLCACGKTETSVAPAAATEAPAEVTNSDDKLQSIETNYQQILKANVGDTVIFGTYEQDNTSNGQEDIEWIVLAKEDNKILILSDKGLDCKQYNTTNTDVTWEVCTLRSWLNDDFLNEAFSSTEQSMIQQTTVTADTNPRWSTYPGNDTTDKVFLLSLTEVEKYFSSNEDRKCIPTAYAIAQNAFKSRYDTKDGVPTGSWWLRSPGNRQSRAAAVHCDDHVYYDGHGVNDITYCVRPALWIDLDS